MIVDRKFMVGTLGRYRKLEAGGDGTGDRLEGTEELYLNYGPGPLTSEVQQALDRTLLNIEGYKDVEITSLRSRNSEADCYMFCSSGIRSEGDLMRWRREEGYDCCVKIPDAMEFYGGLRDFLISEIYIGEECHQERADYQHVCYKRNPDDAFAQDDCPDVPLRFVKDRDRFGWQKETRAAFTPTSDASRSTDGTSHLDQEFVIAHLPDMTSPPQLIECLPPIDPTSDYFR